MNRSVGTDTTAKKNFHRGKTVKNLLDHEQEEGKRRRELSLLTHLAANKTESGMRVEPLGVGVSESRALEKEKKFLVRGAWGWLFGNNLALSGLSVPGGDSSESSHCTQRVQLSSSCRVPRPPKGPKPLHPLYSLHHSCSTRNQCGCFITHLGHFILHRCRPPPRHRRCKVIFHNGSAAPGRHSKIAAVIDGHPHAPHCFVRQLFFGCRLVLFYATPPTCYLQQFYCR